MSGGLRELLKATVLLVALYLLFTHATGFASDVKAATGGYATDVTALQGR